MTHDLPGDLPPDLPSDLPPDLPGVEDGATFRMSEEPDLIALVAVTFGFHPAQSLVVVCVDELGRTFQARTDLAPDASQIPPVVDPLVDAARHNGGRGAFLLTYTDDDRLSRAHLRAMTRGLRGVGTEVVARFRVDDGRWFPMLPRRSHVEARVGVPFEIGHHPLVMRSVLRGDVVHSDRSQLQATLARVPGPESEAVAAAYDALDALPLANRSVLLSEAEWLHRRMRDDAGSWSPATIARVLRAVAVPDVRDVAWCHVHRESAAEHVRLWRRVVTLAPERAVAPAAALLAFSAWIAGDGAMAWCGVERAFAAEPGQSLARLVADALDRAVPPTTWVPMDHRDLPLFAG
jgi:hypothetical protein